MGIGQTWLKRVFLVVRRWGMGRAGRNDGWDPWVVERGEHE